MKNTIKTLIFTAITFGAILSTNTLAGPPGPGTSAAFYATVWFPNTIITISGDTLSECQSNRTSFTNNHDGWTGYSFCRSNSGRR